MIFVGQKLEVGTNGKAVASSNVNNSQPVQQTTTPTNNTQTTTQTTTPAQSTQTTNTGSYTPSRSYGNVGGSVASVANAMAAQTGTSAATWQRIIMRESGGNGQISNASSGAYGYFQLLGHGEHAGMSASQQVAMAAKLYKQAGMSPWGE